MFIKMCLFVKFVSFMRVISKTEDFFQKYLKVFLQLKWVYKDFSIISAKLCSVVPVLRLSAGTSVFLSSETGVSGNIWCRIKGASTVSHFKMERGSFLETP